MLVQFTILFVTVWCFLVPMQVSSQDAPFKSAVLPGVDLLTIIDGMLLQIRQGHAEEAYNQYASAPFRKKTSLKEFTAFVNKYEPVAKNISFQEHSHYIENGIASFQGILTSSSGKALQVEFDLIRENGKWLLYGFQIFQLSNNGT